MTTDRFAGINDGDKVRVEYEDGALEGVYGHYHGAAKLTVTASYLVVLVSDLLFDITRVTVLRRALPPEPPIGSVVMVAGEAWIRGTTYWCTPDLRRTWAGLQTRGIPRTLWTPEDDKAPEHSERPEMQFGMTTPRDVSTYASGDGESSE